MNHLKISTRLTLLIGALAALLIAIGAIGLVGIVKSNDALQTVYEDRTIPTGQIAEIQRQLLRNRLAIAVALVTPTPETIAESVAEVDANIATIGKVWSAYMATTLTPQEARIAAQFAADRARFVQEGLLPTVAALRANDTDTARRLVMEKIRPLNVAVSAGIQALLKLQLDVAREEYDEALARYTVIRAVCIGAIVVGVLFAFVFGLALIRNISRSLQCAVDAANAIAQGDLNQSIPTNGKDEVAQLLRALSAMQQNLERVVSEVREGSQTVATASAQIASSNEDLATRTEQQASALEQTAASMEEFSATVKQNADSAGQANQLALAASTTAVQGGKVVAQVVDTMKGINESSREIADIIGVIDGIAFQTNILALNAAVEAARAGEQGRGFAVVASEVRNLAGRSAAAARNIKNLIDASVQKVTVGSNLVDQAGATMNEVVNGIKRVTDLMGEISAASREQSQGVSQVGEAVTHMDQVTQQNAALVEEMSAAANSLKSQAQDLVSTVSVFKITSGAANDLRGNSVEVRSTTPQRAPYTGPEKRAIASNSRPY
ncbi:methyl-accepting chemotaxis protein [Rhodoferax sp.]|uniref:methyl-accepting chemotaxis protein n=1 Tax=Rhodoferax sp. TaxID=50421 RepID=UPI001EBA9797|nr:methyl-accepting chemotaxis protein [Rhodoferax sp.]MBT9505121.1 Tar ligand binding domain-containing protein [Rhodoferax sp.]